MNPFQANTVPIQEMTIGSPHADTKTCITADSKACNMHSWDVIVVIVSLHGLIVIAGLHVAITPGIHPYSSTPPHADVSARLTPRVGPLTRS